MNELNECTPLYCPRLLYICTIYTTTQLNNKHLFLVLIIFLTKIVWNKLRKSCSNRFLSTTELFNWGGKQLSMSQSTEFKGIMRPIFVKRYSDHWIFYWAKLLPDSGGIHRTDWRFFLKNSLRSLYLRCSISRFLVRFKIGFRGTTTTVLRSHTKI